MSEFERWRDSLGVKYPPSEQIIMEWAFKAGREAGMREAAHCLEMTNGEILLMAGELTAGELRAVKAVMSARLRAILSAIGEGK